MSESLGAFASAFLIIFLAEFGDKTQLALVAIARPGHRLRLWLGATAGFRPRRERARSQGIRRQATLGATKDQGGL